MTQRDDDGSASKKPRVVWSVEMHQQFVQAVNQLGIDSEYFEHCCVKAVGRVNADIMQPEHAMLAALL